MSLILSLLGLGGGIVGIAAHFLFPKLFPGIWTALGKAPRWLIYGGIGLIALVCAFIWHGHEVKQVKAAAFAAGEAKADKDWQTSFDSLKGAFDKVLAKSKERRIKISDFERQLHDQAIRRNADAANDLRLRGPGRAAAPICRANLDTGPGTGPSGPAGSAPDRDAPRPEMPADGGQAIVPWGWLVQRAQEHDDLLSEVTTWRRWYPQQAAENERFKREIPQPEFGKPPTP